MRRTDVFQMPLHAPEPAGVPDPNAPVERNIARDVVQVLHACSEYIAQSHNKLKEFEMKISELSGKVDELISVAKDAKRQQGSGSVGSSAPAQDDPAVQELADRIDQAIKVLKGDGDTGSTGSGLGGLGGSPADPNAPVGGINPSTGLPPPPNPV